MSLTDAIFSAVCLFSFPIIAFLWFFLNRKRLLSDQITDQNDKKVFYLFSIIFGIFQLGFATMMSFISLLFQDAPSSSTEGVMNTFILPFALPAFIAGVVMIILGIHIRKKMGNIYLKAWQKNKDI